jgi:hypothetical protein
MTDEISPLIDVAQITDSSHFFIPSAVGAKHNMATMSSDDNAPADDDVDRFSSELIAKALTQKLQEFDAF